MFLTSLQDKVKRIQELRRSNAAQPVRNKKKYTRKIKHKNKLDNWRSWPAIRCGVGRVVTGVIKNTLEILGVLQKMSVACGIIPLSTNERSTHERYQLMLLY